MVGRTLAIRRQVRVIFPITALFFVSLANLPAVVIFDWPSVPGWTAGAPTPGQTVSQSFTSANPNDITVAINNSGAGSQGMVWNTGSGGYPQVSRTSDTGGFPSTNGLQLLVTSSQVAGAYVQVTVSFATPVANLSFQIWDIDAVAGQFVDRISNIQGLAVGGGTVGADSVTSAVGGFNTVSGSGLGTVVLGTANASNSTNEGTIDIVFNSQITQFSFQWNNNDAGLGAQGIALGPLTYLPVPEADASGIAIAACAVASGIEFLRRKRRRRQR